MKFERRNRRAFLSQTAAASAGVALLATAGSASAQMGNATPVHPVTLPDPTQREGQFLETEDGARIFYQVEGGGEPMLLLHGYPFSGALFARNREALAQHYQVITVDHRGYGKSEAPDVPGDIAIYASDALAVLDALGVDQAIIGGHSMGGPITFEMYKNAADRFRGMILIDTAAVPASIIETALWHGFIDEVKQNGISTVYINSLIKNMLSGNTRVNQPEMAKFLTTIIKQVSEDGAIGGAMALASRADYTDMLGTIEVPALVTVGWEDTYYPVPIAQAMAQAIPNSTLVTISDASHTANFEAPDRTNEAILSWASTI